MRERMTSLILSFPKVRKAPLRADTLRGCLCPFSYTKATIESSIVTVYHQYILLEFSFVKIKVSNSKLYRVERKNSSGLNFI